MPPPAPVRTLSGQELALLTARPETRISFITIVTIVLGAIRGFRNGWPPTSLTLVAGGVLAILGMVRFGLSISTTAGSGERVQPSFGGILPYLYGLYLFAYEGLWSIRGLVQQFTLLHLLTTLLFIYFGYRVVYWTWQLTELADGLRTGSIVVSR